MTMTATLSVSELIKRQEKVEELKKLLKNETEPEKLEELSKELKRAESELDNLKHSYNV